MSDHEGLLVKHAEFLCDRDRCSRHMDEKLVEGAKATMNNEELLTLYANAIFRSSYDNGLERQRYANEVLRRMERVTGWRRVEDELPPMMDGEVKSASVLVMDKSPGGVDNHQFLVAHYSASFLGWFEDDSESSIEDWGEVTHWCPITPPEDV